MNGQNRRSLNAFSVLLVLTVAIFALVLAKPSKIAVSQSPYLHQLAPIPVGEASNSVKRQSVLTSLNGDAPVTSEVNCASCHCDPRVTSTEFPSHSTRGDKTNTLTLQDFLEESQKIPLLVWQGPAFCANGDADSPGYQFDKVIRFLQPQGHSGT